jgi:hypothetical protein
MAGTSRMTRETLWTALAALGRRARQPISLVLGGSAALILDNELRRPTGDGDVVTSEPGLGDLQELIRDVAEHEQLPSGWLNGSIQSYTYILPRDYRDRLVTLPPFGRLTVSLLSRRDVVLMKVYGQRPRDVQDLHAINPTPQELAFVRAQLPRIAAKEKERAEAMREFLDEWKTRT